MGVVGRDFCDSPTDSQFLYCSWSYCARSWQRQHLCQLLRAIENDLSSFMNNLVLSRLVPTLAAFFVLRAILDSADGGHPLPSILTAMFLLAVPTTYNLIQSFNSGSSLATADVLDGLWNYLAGQIMPIAAGLAVIGAIINFARQRPVMRLVLCSLAFLSVSALWRLVLAMM